MLKVIRLFGVVGLVAAFVVALPSAVSAQPTTVDACVNQWNGATRIDTHCNRSEYALQWQGDVNGDVAACVNNWNDVLRISDHCSRSEHAISWNSNPWGNVTACVNQWNGATRIADYCSRSEYPVSFDSLDFLSDSQCDPNYTNVCLPSAPDLNCSDLMDWMKPVTVLHVGENPDPHHLDGNHDGIGCSS